MFKLKQKVDVDVIDRIHEDFDKAGDELLEKAEEILEEVAEEKTVKVYEALERFGFNNVNEVQAFEKKKSAKKNAKLVIANIKHYRENYPKNKFITIGQIRDICKKYGLVFGPTKAFIGEIPDKNKLEMAEFKVKSDDDANGEWKEVSIVASKDEFNLSNYEVEKGWELKEIPRDPIVLWPVHGGFLVVTKWGKEENLDELR